MTASRSNGRRVVAVSAWLAVGLQVAFVLAWIVGGALQDHYSQLEQYVSELGADTANSRWLANGAFVLLGASFGALAVGLWRALPRTRRSLLAVALFALCGLGFALLGVFKLDCAPTLDGTCERLLDDGALSWQTYAHFWTGLGLQLSLLLTPFALAWATWKGRAGRPAFAAGILGLFIAGVSFVAGSEDAVAGLVERWGLASVHIGVALVALGLLLWSAQPPTRPPRAAGSGSLEPFRFLAPHYTGSGEVAWSWWTRPFRLPHRFGFERRVDYAGGVEWRLHDVLRFERGPSFDRTMEAEPVAADLMRLSADDMPGGLDTVLRPGGLRLEPFWLLSPWWGMPWPLRCSGEMRLEADDGLTVAAAFKLFGFLPLGRLHMRLARSATQPDPVPQAVS
jgi:uncharacterized protein DUF998